MDMAERDFCQASLEYVFQLQAVQERKKFELVETLLGFVFGWWTFHHTAHDVHADAEPRVRDLQLRIQRVTNDPSAPSPSAPLYTSLQFPVSLCVRRQVSRERVSAKRRAATRSTL